MRAAALLVLAVLAVGCTKRDEKPLPPPPPATSWTAEATATVSANLMDAAGKDAWAAQWKARNQGAVPVVALRPIDDRTGDSIPVAELRAAMAARLREVGGDRIAVADGDQGTVVLTGVATMIPGTAAGGARVQRYSIDLRLADAAGDPLWTGAVEHELPPLK
ncbi:MAG: hypothetical protein RLZZ127_1871 [Planctomycetota bacterium]|jgi:hypothetical protein